MKIYLFLLHDIQPSYLGHLVTIIKKQNKTKTPNQIKTNNQKPATALVDLGEFREAEQGGLWGKGGPPLAEHLPASRMATECTFWPEDPTLFWLTHLTEISCVLSLLSLSLFFFPHGHTRWLVGRTCALVWDLEWDPEIWERFPSINLTGRKLQTS